MVQPVRLFKKVPLIYLSHILAVTSVIIFVTYPVLRRFLQSGFDRYLENLVTIGESIQTQLDNFSDSLISLLKWAHRERSIYPYDPCTDSLLKKEIKRQQINRKTDWESIISEYKLEMCKQAVGIIGQETQKIIRR